MHEFIDTTVTITHDTSTTQYGAKDIISAGTTVPMAFQCNLNGGKIVKVMIKTNLATFTGLVRLWFYSGTAPAFAADNAAMNMLYTENYIGYVETSLEAWGTGCSIGGVTDELSFGKTSSNTIGAVLTTGVGSTPTPANGMKITVTVTTENFG